MADSQGKRPSPRAQDDSSAPDSTRKRAAGKTEAKLIHLTLEEEMLERIDDFRFENRFYDRARAVRWLLKWALNHADQEANKDAKGRKPKKKERRS